MFRYRDVYKSDKLGDVKMDHQLKHVQFIEMSAVMVGLCYAAAVLQDCSTYGHTPSLMVFPSCFSVLYLLTCMPLCQNGMLVQLDWKWFLLHIIHVAGSAGRLSSQVQRS